MFKVPEKYEGVWRFQHILQVLIKHGFGALFDHKDPDVKHSRRAEHRLRLAFEELGGTFVKLGQLLSLRPDLVPVTFSHEFEQLQDHVESLPSATIREIIEHNLRRPVDSIFSKFNDLPLASASIGQVHRATLLNGNDVVIKVMRPNIRTIFKEDLSILRFFAKHLKKKLEGLIDPEAILSEFETYTLNELDYRKEADNIKQFSNNMKNNIKVKVPTVHSSISTDRVLVMDFLEGYPLSNYFRKKSSDYNSKKISQNIAESVLQQVFVDGFFHADPHPGNILIYPDNSVSFIDFGIMGELKDKRKVHLAMLFSALLNKDLDNIILAMKELGVTKTDDSNMRQEIKDLLGPYYGKPLSKIPLVLVFHGLLGIIRKYHMSIPKDFVLLGKSLVTLEGVCHRLDPSFNLVLSSKPFMEQNVSSIFSKDMLLKLSKESVTSYARLFRDLPKMMKKHLEADSIEGDELRKLNSNFSNLTRHLELISGEFMIGSLAIVFLVLGAILIDRGNSFILGVSFISALCFLFGLIFTGIMLKFLKDSLS